LVIGSALFRKDVSLEESVRQLRASFAPVLSS